MKPSQPNASTPHEPAAHTLSRRRFIAGVGAGALAASLSSPELVRGAESNAKLRLGLIGCGGRGLWIGELFRKHGGYSIVAAADYFPDRINEAERKLGVPAERCFTGLNGYQRLLDQKLDAVVIETPPYFHPEQAAAAVDAGKHVYLAKPVAVDVPGCQTIADTGQTATEKKLCMLVDFQTRAGATFQEAARRVHDGQLGPIISAETGYQCGPTFDKQDKELRKDPDNPETRLRAWGLSRVLSGDAINEQNIHSLDLATWFLDAEPLKAYGTGGQRRNFAGDCWDHYGVIYHLPGGVFLDFSSKQAGFGYDDIFTRVYGLDGMAEAHYFGEVRVKAREDVFDGGRTANLYTTGVQTNIATFHDNIVNGVFSNPTVAPSVRSNLTAILGRTAAYRHTEVTWAEIMQANQKFEFDPRGLKA